MSSLLGSPHEGYMLAPETTKLFSNILNHTTLFDVLIDYFKDQIILKEVIINGLRRFISVRNKKSSALFLNDLEKLYSFIGDLEIKRELINELNRLGKSFSPNNFVKNHKLKDSYNNCYYLQYCRYEACKNILL